MSSSLTWLHISDIHFNQKNEWRDSTTREELLSFLKGVFKEGRVLFPDYIFCTGDIAFGHSSKSSIDEQYTQAREFFDGLLDICGGHDGALSRSRLYVVPGNHDVNRDLINQDAQMTLNQWAGASNSHCQKINQRFEDKSKEFIDTIQRLENFSRFVKEYLPHQVDHNGRLFYANEIDWFGINVGISCFNSAWSCSGPEDDRNIWLAAPWQFNKSREITRNSDISIGLIHHPIDWLNVSDRDFATRAISSNFDFWLHGHSHSAWVNPSQYNVTIAAGAVGAEDNDEFGVNITTVDFQTMKGSSHLFGKNKNSFGWTIMPVAKHAPHGVWQFDLPLRLEKLRRPNDGGEYACHISQQKPTMSAYENARINKILTCRLNDALRSFSSQPNIWIEPLIHVQPEMARDVELEDKFNIDLLLNNPTSTILKAPQQYGLTCLALHLICQAWSTENSLFWLYLDAKKIKAHKGSIEEALQSELVIFGLERGDIKCVVLDSWVESGKDAYKQLNNISTHFEGLPIICMQTMDGLLSAENSDRKLNRDYTTLYLWSLVRNDIRKIVVAYNEKKNLGDEDAVTNRLISDLEVLNLHRTALNCLTLLKVSENRFEESPVNRSELIKQVLNLLFSSGELPNYKRRPDLKDCEYVLGYFCENLIRSGNHLFSRDQFITEIQRHCQSRLIDLETQVVFDVLYANCIIADYGNFFYFKFSYWIYYFAAQRMHHDQDFSSYIFENIRYARYPELIEFYTGIDRRRDDALKILINDLKAAIDQVQEKCGFPERLDPYRFAQWNTSDSMRERMAKEVSDGVQESSLPAIVKDEYADRHYDRTRPYDQSISSILTEHSFVLMMQTMKAASRALRNSDYACPELKRQLLGEILRAWEQASKVLFVILPVLATEGRADFDGAAFLLSNDFSDDPQNRFLEILQEIPRNVVSWVKDDLFSQKMGPLLFDQASNSTISGISKHELMLMLIEQRPRDWGKQIQKYVASISKNSFYLFDIYRTLRAQYRYGYVSPAGLSEIEYLIKVAAAKHVTGDKDPGVKSIKKAKLLDDVIPKREN